ncbi:ChbG/HpnK family deacetylase [Streptococcus castoreus]|uniref:ChbG/HpnK family deacetylase n=1 Tax=Streptococcus castoreus TaxID=254786 RepID=UPI0004144EF0|nr:ChbG/HpnK family deacetylase [Streptococcus castoreus]
MSKKVIFRGDDLGYSEGVNYGIHKAVSQGLIRSQGVMVNMPATQHGVTLVKDYDIAFSVHVNICNGRPLTDPALIPSLVTEDGFFKSSTTYRSSKEEFVVYEEVILEVEAQYLKFTELFGRKPDYFEGHAVASQNFFNALETIARKYDLKYSGLPKNFNQSLTIGTSRVRMTMASMLPDYDPFDMVKTVVEQMSEDIVELFVFHPGYLDWELLQTSSMTMIRPQEVAMLTGSKIKTFLDKKKVELIDYRDL